MPKVLFENILRGKTKVLNLIFLVLLISVTGSIAYVFAADTSTFNQTINAGTLSVDIVDDTYVSVSEPSIDMSTLSFGFTCQNSTGTFGTSTQQIYVKNPDAADSGWTVSIGTTNTSLWESAGTDFDFNDPTGSGCTDGADADSFGGQMTVDASVGSVAVGSCSSCTTTGVSAGSSNAFSEGIVDDITILSGAAGSDDIGDWTLRGVSISQTVPAEQPAASDYSINMVLSILAN
ncbi:hypothetical protein K0B04_02190 [Patescibacteria group bacterium]|nr:hypothetical protein [Patescibacteria group bacterium]